MKVRDFRFSIFDFRLSGKKRRRSTIIRNHVRWGILHNLPFAAGTIIGVLALAGCAQKQAAAPVGNPATLATPTADELPVIEARRDITPLKVGVEDHSRLPRKVLVQKYDVPPRTPAERRALGETDPAYDFLALYKKPPPENLVSTMDGGARYGSSNITHRTYATGARTSPLVSIDMLADANLQFVYPIANVIAGVGAVPWPMWAVGMEGGMSVHEGPPSRISAHQKNDD